MRQTRSLTTILAMVLVLAACGGDSATTTTTTAAPSTTAATTTTAAPTTTAATTTTTTIPADTHPEFGVRWEEVWPDASMSATYRVTTFGGEEIDLPARMEYGVDFAGGTYDRLVVGSAEPGAEGMVIYFDRSEPWQITVVGEEVFRAGSDEAESVYVFDTPMVFDGLATIGETRQTEGRLSLTLADGNVLDLGVIYDVTLRGLESVTVAAGDFDDVLVVDVGVSGELLGGDFRFPLEIWLDAQNLFVNYTGASGFDALELLEPWA